MIMIMNIILLLVKQKKVKNESLDIMKNDLDGLKSEMNEIKSLLKELVNGN